MSEEKDYLNKCIKFIEDLPPSKANMAIWTMLKAKFIPRLKRYINGEEKKAEDMGEEEIKDFFKKEEGEVPMP